MGLITIPKSKVTPVADPLLSSFAAEIDLVGRLTEEADLTRRRSPSCSSSSSLWLTRRRLSPRRLTRWRSTTTPS